MSGFHNNPSPSPARGRAFSGHRGSSESPAVHRERQHSIISRIESIELPSSFVSTAPIAREILAQDIAECSSEEDEYDDDDQDHEDPPEPRLGFHPTGVAFGCGFSTIAVQGPDEHVANPHEIEQSLHDEVLLLRDNHILPPAEGFRRGSVLRHVFSTTFRDHHDDEPSSERSPLLGPSDERQPETPPPEEVHKQWEEAVASHSIKTTWQREAQTLAFYSSSLIVTFLLHYSVTVGSVLAVGRLGMVELAAVNLATMTASITCYVPVQGLATCLDTLCAQAYGLGHRHLVGLQAQRMTWLLWLLMVPVAFLWWFSGPILRAAVPDAEAADLAALYLRVLILGMPGVAAFESGKRFVGAQGLFRATTCALLVSAPLSFLLNYLFVFRAGWGFAGAAAAMAITQNLIPILLVLYVIFVEGSGCWGGFSRKAFSNWGPMIKLALPGMIMIEAQFSVLEILTIAAGRLGTAQLAAQSVLVTVTSMSFNIPFPLAIATSTRVANLIGAGLSDAAMVTTRVAIFAALGVGIFNLTIFTTLRTAIPRVFTNDLEVIDIVSNVILVCAVMQIFDALAAISHGILRGIGRQAIGGYANLFSYYVVALPVSLSLAFAAGWNLSGLWAGLVAGLATVSALEMVYLYYANWDTAVIQAKQRMHLEDGHAHN